MYRQYVALMGGQIGVDSEPGKGSVFHFEIPVAGLPSAVRSTAPVHGRTPGLAAGQRRYRFYIAEGQPENMIMIAQDRGQYADRPEFLARMVSSVLCLLAMLFWMISFGLCSPPAEAREGTVSLTPEERQWLSMHDGAVRIGITVIPPQVIHRDGGYEGLSIDHIRLMERKLGCRFSLVPFDTWNQVIQAAKERSIDMIFAAQETPERLGYLLFTEPYIELQNMILTRKDRTGGADLREMKGWSVATSKGSAVHEYLRTKFPYLDLRPVPNELSGLMKVSLGEADAMVVEISRASYYIEKQGILNLRVSGDAGLSYRLRYAVRNDWPLLRDILNKGLSSISIDEQRDINRRWIIVEQRSVFARRAFWISLAAVLGVIVLAVAMSHTWTRTLRNRVKANTEQLRRELAEKKRAEEKLSEQEQVLTDILEVTLSGFWDWNIPGHTEFLSPALKKMFGYEDHELPNSPDTWQKLILPEDLPTVLECFDRHVKSHGREPYYNEVRYRHKCGSTIWVICAGRVIEWAEDGSPVRMIGCHVDITERKRAEQDLRRLYEELDRRVNNRTAELAARNEDLQRTERELIREREFGRALLESMADGVVACDAEGTLALFNRKAREWHGTDPTRLPPEQWASHYDLFRADGVTPLPTDEIPLAMAFNGEEVKDVGMAIMAKGQAPRFILANGSIIKGSDGRKLGAVVIMRDVTALRSLEQELRRSNEELEWRVAERTAKLEETARNLQEAQHLAHIGSWELDLTTNALTWSDEIYRMFEIDPEKFGASYEAFLAAIHPDDREAVNSAYTNSLKTRTPYTIEHRLLFPNGRIKYVHEQCETYYDNGTPLRSMGTVQDITERRQADEALRESRQRLDNILANSPGAIYRCANDEHWTMEVISAGITRISGFPADEFIDNEVRSFASIIHPDDRQSVADAVADGVARKEHYETDYRLLAVDGSPRWVHQQGRGVFDPDGRLLCLDGVIFDISAQREAEETVKLNAERMECLIQLSQMSAATQEEIFSFAFEAAIRLTRSKLGYLALMNEDESVLTMQLWSREAIAECEAPAMPRIYPAETTGPWSEAVRQRRPIISNDYSAPNPSKNGAPEGRVRLFRYMNLPIIVDGKIVLVAGVGNKAEDYTETDVQQLSLLMEGMWRLIERKRSEEEIRRYHNQLEDTVRQRTEELRLSRDAAEAANEAKSLFLANMSHELRTPLNAILGFSGIVRKDPLLPKNEQQNLDIINRSGEHLLTLINDVLEMAKIEAGSVLLNTTAFDLGSMLRDVADMMQMRAKEKELQLLIDQSSQFPRFIVGDEARLRQVLINLIGNAIKYTEQGGVAVRLSTKQNERVHLLIEVEDSGPGIGPQDQPRVFEPFVQLAQHGTSKGTGLGLTITRQYVQMMGGNIDLESTPGKGSLFRVDLPLTEATEADVGQAKQTTTGEVAGLEPGQPRYRILIVEDQKDNQALLAHLLMSVGLEIKIAENGKQGVEIFRTWQPHLILMDRRMPVMNGEQATQRVRELPGGREVKIVAVTASAFKEQREEMLKAGMDDFVGKPYRPGEIYACLARQLGIVFRYEGEAEPQQQAQSLTPEMLSVLPATLRALLREAVQSLDAERIDLVLRQVAAHDQALQQTLKQLTEYFDYSTILQALNDAEGSESAPNADNSP